MLELLSSEQFASGKIHDASKNVIVATATTPILPGQYNGQVDI
jgi:hypothetical protein